MKTRSEVEKCLSTFDLLLAIIQIDCKRYKYLAKVKSKIKEATRELRNIPVPKGVK